LQTPGPKSRVLVTGANGFIGSALVTALLKASANVRGTVRESSAAAPSGVNLVSVGDLTSHTDWRAALRDVDAVVHTAARVHLVGDRAANPLANYRKTNVDSTLNLARQAVASGVRRFVFLSSIKVNGESTPPGRPFDADDPPMPLDHYAVSKHEAEAGLQQLARETGIQVVIIRPVLVYGPGVKANFLSMMTWIESGFPLPFGAIHNARSLVALGNLIDLITTCLYHPKAQNQTFLVSDGEDLSTPELLRRTGAAMGRPARLMPVPEIVLRSTATHFGKAEMCQRLCGSLQVDIGKTQRLLGWRPVISVDQALKEMARYFLDAKT
jgi:nucleoside-diphosphate-sugar epimerase